MSMCPCEGRTDPFRKSAVRPYKGKVMRASPAPRRLRHLGLALSLSVGLIGLVASACDSSPVSPSGQPNLTIMLTDDITDDVEQVNVYFTSVTAKPVGGPVVELALEPGVSGHGDGKSS